MSSASNKYIPNEEAVPLVKSEIFDGHEDKQFALGVYGSEDILCYKPGSVEEAYLRLRANVYINQTGMLEDSLKRRDGTEMDADDERSTHFVVFENRLGGAAVFACMRLIVKTPSSDSALPIESFFPEAFVEPAPQKSIEVSRFIVRHDTPAHSRASKKELMTAGIAHVFSNNLGPVYGTMEPSFERDLKLMRLPTRRIAEPKLVSEYNDNNLGIEIDTVGFRKRLGEAAVEKMAIQLGGFGYWGEIIPEDAQVELGQMYG